MSVWDSFLYSPCFRVLSKYLISARSDLNKKYHIVGSFELCSIFLTYSSNIFDEKILEEKVKKNKARRKLTCFTWSLAFLIQSAGEIIRPHLKHFAPKSLKYQEQIVHFLEMTFWIKISKIVEDHWKIPLIFDTKNDLISEVCNLWGGCR